MALYTIMSHSSTSKYFIFAHTLRYPLNCLLNCPLSAKGYALLINFKYVYCICPVVIFICISNILTALHLRDWTIRISFASDTQNIGRHLLRSHIQDNWQDRCVTHFPPAYPSFRWSQNTCSIRHSGLLAGHSDGAILHNKTGSVLSIRLAIPQIRITTSPACN